MSPLLRLAARHLRAHGLRGALTAAGVACGVALVVAIQVVNASTLQSFTDAIDDLAGTAALQIRGPGSFPEALADEIRDLKGIDHAVPILTATFFTVDGPTSGEALSVFAADVSDGHAVKTLHLVRSGDRVVDDPLEFLVDPRSIVVTDVFAARQGLVKNTPIRLRTPAGIQTFTVRGILAPGGVGRAFGGNLILMDVVGAQTVLGRDRQLDQIDVTLRPGVSVEDATARIAPLLHDGLEVLRPAARGEQIERYLSSYRTLLAGVSGLALLAAVFVIGSAVGTSVSARRREIGVLRCIGAERRHVVRLFVGEAVLMGVVGTTLGVPLGLGLAHLMLDLVNESTEIVFSMRTFRAGLAIPPTTLALAVLTGLGAALAAGWLPARQALAISPLAAVRPGAPPPIGRRWPAPGAILVAFVLVALGLWAQVARDSAWGGNVAALATDFALICCFMRVAAVTAGVVLRPWRPRCAAPEQLAIDRLVRIPDQLALAAGVLALGLGLMLMAGTLLRSFEESMLGFIRRQVRADLVVASTASTGWIESPLPAALAERLGRVPGVARVECLRLAEQDFDGTRISVDALDSSAFAPDRADDFVFAAGVPADALATVRAGSGVLVSRNLARQRGLGLGGSLRLSTPSGPYDATIAGIVVDYVSPRGSVILSRAEYADRWRDHTANRFHLTVAPGASIDAVRTALAAGIGAELALKVLTQRQLYDYHVDAVHRAFRFTLALQFLPLVVAGLGLAEALLAVSIDRARDFALLRAAGATRAQVIRTVLAEAAGVGALGFVGGMGMGLVLAVLWVRVNFAYQIGWDLDFHFATGALLPAAVAALVVSMVAGVLPARRTAGLPVLRALREA